MTGNVLRITSHSSTDDNTVKKHLHTRLSAARQRVLSYSGLLRLGAHASAGAGEDARTRVCVHW